MTDNAYETNKVTLIGKIASDFEYSHVIFGEKFYKVFLDIPRLSDNKDNLPVMVSERLLEDLNLEKADTILVKGQLRSYNKKVENKSRLILVVFAKDLELYNDEEGKDKHNPNYIYLDGFICKPTIYRETPFGREISDMLLAVNRLYNKSDYIPCIAWGRNAKYAKNLQVGDRIKVWGRIQSRKYEKKLSEDNVEERVAYEVSISKIMGETIDENKISE